MKNILLLPGMMCDERVFSPQIRFLKDFPIEVARLEGFDSLESLAQNVLKETPFASFVLCGLSMGGILAMEMIQQARERIEGIILLDTNYLAEKEEKKAIRLEQLAKIKQGKFKSIIVDELKPFYLKENSSSESKELKELFYQMAMDLGEETFVNQSLALRDRRGYEAVLKSWKKPALIICGEADVLCPPERHQAMKKLLTNSELWIIKDSGHVSNLESPAEVNEIIKNWLAKLN